LQSAKRPFPHLSDEFRSERGSVGAENGSAQERQRKEGESTEGKGQFNSRFLKNPIHMTMSTTWEKNE